MEQQEHDSRDEAPQALASRESQPLEETDTDRVFRWRFSQLLAAGYGGEEAIEIALRPDIDLHLATSLLGRGCSRTAALRILL